MKQEPNCTKQKPELLTRLAEGRCDQSSFSSAAHDGDSQRNDEKYLVHGFLN